MKIENLFPVQKQVIPVILNSDRSQSLYPNDICVTAPTGSGKTLTYVLPILQSLSNRIRPSCRAIVILPVSDLAEQVYTVFKEQIALLGEENCNLRVLLLSNMQPFQKEQQQLMTASTIDLKLEPKCLVDILVATPGRLVDHIQKTSGFSRLPDLRFLVLDECDRIMDQIKQNWLPILNQAVFGTNKEDRTRQVLNTESLNVHNVALDKSKLMPYQKLLLSATLTRNPEKLEQIKLFQPIFFSIGAEKLQIDANQREAIAALNKIKNTALPASFLRLQEKEPKVVLKPTVPEISAEDVEMTPNSDENVQNDAKNPEQTDKKEKESNKSEKKSSAAKQQKIVAPDEEGNINVPDELNERFVEVSAFKKPLMAIHLIKTLGYKRLLCFVKTKETAHRLNKLFELNGINSMEYSSALHAARRKRIQSRFEEGKLDVLVCSDMMARGMDLANVDYVLLYDAPVHLSSYIHKVGRTARAGRTGTAITFLVHKEIFFFKKLMKQKGQTLGHKIKEIKIPKSKLRPLMPDYENSMLKLKDVVNKAPTRTTSKNSKKDSTTFKKKIKNSTPKSS